MPSNPKSRPSRDSFLETLNAETLAGTENLSAWLRHVAAQERTEIVFELEAWLRGLRAFFDIRHLPLTGAERANLVSRSFSPEIRIVYRTLLHVERISNAILSVGQPQKLEFETFVEAQLRKGARPDLRVSRVLEQPTPLDSLSHFLEALNDLRMMVQALKDAPDQSYPVFLGIGRCFQRDLRDCRYIDMLLTQRFKVQFDQVDNTVVRSLLRSIRDKQVRQHVSLALLHLYRLLRYLKIVSQDLVRDRPLRHYLVIFSLLHEEMGNLSQFLKAGFLRRQQAGQGLWNAVELIVYSLQIESQRALERELVFVSQERQAPPIYTKIENSHGLLRNCFQSSIVALVQALDKSVDAKTIFPSTVDRLQEAQKLLQELWDLRQAIKDLLDKGKEFDLNRVMDRLTSFRESSLRYLMYRDWGEFERLSDAIITATSEIELRTLLRKFVSFLEALVQEVSNRSVLRESPAESILRQ